MMLDPTANHMRIPAAPAFIPSQASKSRVRICHQCGFVLPQDFPWIVCNDCQLSLRESIPFPKRTLLAKQDAMTLGQAGQFSTCISCRMTVEGPRITSTSYTLCPACRVKQEGTKLKPTMRINLSIPSLPPPVVAPPCNPPRPCFFNSRGEIVAPFPVLVAVAPMRVCMRFGCGARLAPNQLFNFCDACVRLGFGRGAIAPPPPLKHFPKRMRIDELFSGVLISKFKQDIDATQGVEALVQPPRETFTELGACNNDDLDTDLDLELMYPEDEEVAAQDSVDLTAKVVVDDAPPSGAVLEDGSSRLSPLVLNTTTRSPSPQLVQGTCETPGCGGTVSPSATWQRCYNCSLQRWKERQQAATATTEPVLPVDGTHEGASNSAEVMHGIGPSSHDARDATMVDRVATSRESGVLASHSQEAVLDAVDKLPLSEFPDEQVAVNSATVASTSSTLIAECGRDAGQNLKLTRFTDGTAT
ncbi:hypothetical protein BDR07DRAFT_581291 [Suillus spraguei]|nr:hypothetical protein BDR07DRAFT_581291 [Suillus spraguei]